MGRFPTFRNRVHRDLTRFRLIPGARCTTQMGHEADFVAVTFVPFSLLVLPLTILLAGWRHRNAIWMDRLLNHPPFFAPYFITVWMLTCYGMGLMSGWVALSRKFRHKGTFHDEKWPFQSARMKSLVGYANCLNIGANESGLYMSVPAFFRIGHAPLLVPWTEISVVQGERGLPFKKRELRVGREEAVPLRIKSSLAVTLRQEAATRGPSNLSPDSISTA